jgi:alpha-galactosidase
MLARSAMSSFSDAHEIPEIPIIAANLHRLMLPRQSQIWSVLHKSDSHQRLAYSLAATFLGRMCLSGEIDGLDDGQWRLVQQAIALYQQAAPVIKHGTSRLFRSLGPSWRHPAGWQAVRRISDDGQRALLVVHTFANAPATIEVPWPAGAWQITGQLSGQTSPTISGGALTLANGGDFTGAVYLLKSDGSVRSV